MSKNKVAQIVPMVRLKRDLAFFDYLIPVEFSRQIKIGQIVEIPFRQKTVSGLVLSLAEKSQLAADKLKFIRSIVYTQPLISPWQLTLIKYLANYYFVSVAVLARMIIPHIPKRQSRAKNLFAGKIEFVPDFLVNTKITQLLKMKKPVLIRYNNFRSKIDLYHSLISDTIKKNKQIVIIVPQILDIEKIMPFLGDFKEKISVYLNDLPKGQSWQEWQRINNNEAQIIIGTRSAIFAPFKKLGTIIIDEEDNANHKQIEPNPRYLVHDVALKIKELLKCNLYFVSSSPSLNSLYNVQKKHWQYYQVQEINDLPFIKIIDRQEEFKKGNFTIFSEGLQEKIEYNLKRAQKTFLFVNRKGLASQVVCSDCGFIVLCPTCKLPLTFHADKKLNCHHCDYKQDVFLSCPQCHGTNIKLTGLGTEKVEQALKQLYPLARILKLDLESPLISALPDFDVIIGTQYAFDYVNWSEISTIGVINADGLFYGQDYRSLEKTFNLLVKMANFLSSSKKQLLVQTFSPELYIYKALPALDYKSFYFNEIKERQAFSYPPCSQLIKLIYQNFEYNTGQKEILDIYQNLLHSINPQKLVINPPAIVYTQQVRGRWRWQIIIKVLDQSSDLNFLNQLPESVLIDRDPESVR